MCMRKVLMDPLWTSSPACNLKNPGRNQVGDESGLKRKALGLVAAPNPNKKWQRAGAYPKAPRFLIN